MDDLIAVHRDYVAAQKTADKLQAARAKAIRQAVAGGTRQADIARALDLTPMRISQIVAKG